MTDAASTDASHPGQPLPRVGINGNPWKRPSNNSNMTASIEEFPPVNAASAPRASHPVAPSDVDRRQYNSEMLPGQRLSNQDHSHDQRSQAEASNRESRMQQSGDARYQYDQNTYDRHWQNPLPQTREIFNSTTGRFEQIEPNHKTSRRPSHHERKSGDVLPRHQIQSGDARRTSNVSITPMAAASHKSPIVSPMESAQMRVQPTVSETVKDDKLSTKDNEATSSSVPVANPSAINPPAPLDPSSQEFIDMQKSLMAERREQAIQRRKDQEAEEAARKDRARKKAEELAALADKEKSKKEADQKAKSDATQPKSLVKAVNKITEVVSDKAINSQKETGTVARPVAHERPNSHDTQARKHKDDALGDKERKVQIKGAVSSTSAPKTQFDRRDHFSLTSPTKKEIAMRTEDNTQTGSKREPSSPSRNVWGPIGSKNATSTHASSDQNRPETLLGSFGLDNELPSHGKDKSLPTSPPSNSKQAQIVSPSSWSAFDAITQSRRVGSSENREYNVFDAADEVIAPERHRHSPPGQSQANRTSSRFFPSSSANPIASTSSKLAAPFVSPVMPPRIDSIANVHFEPLDTTPHLVLPAAASQSPSNQDRNTVRSIDQVMSTIRGSMLSETSQSGNALRQARTGARTWLDTQTRSVWEIKPLRTGQSPRVRVPYTEKTLDWSRKEKPAVASAPNEKGQTESQKVEGKLAQISVTGLPATPAWTLPKNLETTSKASSIVEPLIPPQPSLKLPAVTDDSILSSPLLKRRKNDRVEQDRVGKFYTTRPALVEAPDNMSPIRIKTSDAEVQIQRRFGRRVDAAQQMQKKVSDVKRQPVNMSDAPGGSGFKRGFANRVRTSQSTTPVSSPAPVGKVAVSRTLSQSPSVQQVSSPTMVTQDNRALPAMQPVQAPSQVHIHQPQPQYFSVPQHATQSFPIHRESPQPQHFVRHAQSPMMQGPISSRVAPPGLSIMKHDDSQGQNGAQTASAPASRGPPGIVLPGN